MVRCVECGKPIIEESKANDWSALWHFFEFLLSEGYIEKETWDTMATRLETFKAYAFDWEWPQLDYSHTIDTLRELRELSYDTELSKLSLCMTVGSIVEHELARITGTTVEKADDVLWAIKNVDVIAEETEDENNPNNNQTTSS